MGETGKDYMLQFLACSAMHAQWRMTVPCKFTHRKNCVPMILRFDEDNSVCRFNHKVCPSNNEVNGCQIFFVRFLEVHSNSLRRKAHELRWRLIFYQYNFSLSATLLSSFGDDWFLLHSNMQGSRMLQNDVLTFRIGWTLNTTPFT